MAALVCTGTSWTAGWCFRSADQLTLADADDPQPRQRRVGHLDAHALAGAQEAQATGVHHCDVEGNLAAIVEQHTARPVLDVVAVHACLHVPTLALGRMQYDRGVPSDPDGDGITERLVVVYVGAKGGKVKIQSYAVARVLAC